MQLFYRFRPFNRRRAPRFEPYRLIECTCVYLSDGQRQESLSEIVNVSRVGLLLVTNEKKIYPKTEVEIHIDLPFGKIILLHGVIVWTQRKHSQSWYYSGVELHDSEKKGIDELIHFVTGISKKEGADNA